MADMDRWIAEMSATPKTTTMMPPPPMTLQQPSSLPKQTESPLTTPEPLEKSESNQVASRNLKKSDRPIPWTPMPSTTTTIMPTYPSQPLHQPASLPTSPTTFSSLPNTAATRKPVDLAVLQCQILRNMEEADRIYPLLVDNSISLRQRSSPSTPHQLPAITFPPLLT